MRKTFREKGGAFRILYGQQAPQIKAVDGVSFEIREGEVFGLIGGSGAGKTTTAKLVLRLLEPTQGKVYFEGVDLISLPRKALKAMRRQMQVIFQDPYASLNPGMRVYSIIEEPLVIHNVGEGKKDRLEIIHEALEAVGLKPAEAFMQRFPHQLSGGQRQRVAIARSLVLRPQFVVADEPTSMLDVSVRAGILNLMQDLKQEFHLTYLFITHDLAVARYMCDRIAVMYKGRILELGPTEDVINEPLHPYTQALLRVVEDLPSVLEYDFMIQTSSFQRASFIDTPKLSEAKKGHFVASYDF